MKPSQKPLAALVVLLAAAPYTRAADSPPATAARHRVLTFRLAQSDAPGDNIAVADFYADAAHQPDGSDFRVTNAAGNIVPMQILQVSGQDDRVRLVFATKTEGAYTVTWGIKPEKPAPPLEIKRGIFAEIFHLPAAAVVRTPEAIDQNFAKAGPRISATFVNTLSLGYIPVGPQDDVMVRYTAQFTVAQAGNYDISLAVGKAGYLAIDGNPVLNDFGGRMARDARNFKTLNLAVGWHSVAAAQINRNGGETGIEVAWRKSGDPALKYITLPAGVQCTVAKCVDGTLEGAKTDGDFAIEPQAEGFFTPDSFCPRYVFDSRLPAGVTADKAAFSWDFGDGQTSTLRRVNHYFLSPGVYPVTFTLQSAGVTYKAVRRITIGDRLVDLFPTPPEDQPKAIAAVIDGYDPAKLTAASALRGVLFYQKQAREQEFITWGKAWLQKKDAQDAQTVSDMALDLSLDWIARGESAQAAQGLEWASQKNLGVDHQSLLMHRAVILYAGEAGQPDKAQALASAWNDRLNTSAKNVILAAQAYAAIAKGDGKKAQELVAQTKPTAETHSRQQINQGVMTRNVEAYIRTKDFQEAARILDEWEIEYPETLTEGYSRLLRVKLLVAQGRPETAARIALDHARALPDSFYAAELIYRAAEAFTAANHPGDAKTAMDLLKAKYPESPYANPSGAKP